MLSDSDIEDEVADVAGLPALANLHLTSTISRTSSHRRGSVSSETRPLVRDEPEQHQEGDESGDGMGTAGGEGNEEEAMEEQVSESPPKREVNTVARPTEGTSVGPKKTRVMVRDAAWSTWWAVLYWVSRHYIATAHHPVVHRYHLFRSSIFIIRTCCSPSLTAGVDVQYPAPSRTEDAARMDPSMVRRAWPRAVFPPHWRTRWTTTGVRQGCVPPGRQARSPRPQAPSFPAYHWGYDAAEYTVRGILAFQLDV
jgi:hypothetical protein